MEQVDFAEYSAGEAIKDASIPTSHTQNPLITGTSVIAIKFKDGVVIAADNLASYGSLARFTDMERLVKVGDETVVGFGGDVSDMQYLIRYLEDFEINENAENDGYKIRTKTVYSYLSKTFYHRRTKMDPLWNSAVVAGFDKDEPFLGYVNLLGVTYSSPAIGTGFGAYLAVPLLRQLVGSDGDEKNVTEEQARQVIDTCMKVLFYRDARSIDRYSLAVITKKGIEHHSQIKIQNQSWRFASGIKGYGNQAE